MSLLRHPKHLNKRLKNFEPAVFLVRAANAAYISMEATQMKPVGFISTLLATTAMFLLFGFSAPVRAQEEHPQEAKPAEGAPHDQETKPSEEAKPPRDSAKPSEAKPPKDEKPKENAPRDNNKPEARTETRTQTESKTVQHGRAENGRIPDADFHAHFGREHHFHVGHPQVINSQSRFQYGGYSFTFVEAWPVGWGYDDDFFIDFIDGQYYLIDLRHPEARLALVVVL
jgi:hypothetical protein